MIDADSRCGILADCVESPPDEIPLAPASVSIGHDAHSWARSRQLLLLPEAIDDYVAADNPSDSSMPLSKGLI